MPAAHIATRLGTFTAHFTEAGLAGIDFPGSARGTARRTSANASGIPPARLDEWKQQTTAALTEALDGRRPETLPPLDWSHGSEFQRRVWSALLEIAPGETRTYSEVAKAVGHPGGARAVGAACGANPIPVLVPCHRVLAAGNRLGGFSGGLEWKRRLLALEAGATFALQPG